jgi:hypothetical protein
MTDKPRKPAWWTLYALVPAMGGLLFAESRASLSPSWHKCVQIGIVLVTYSLVWAWLRANDRAMLRDCLNRAFPNKDTWNATDRAENSAFRSSETCRTPDQGYGDSVRRGSTLKYINSKAQKRGMRKCSHSLGQQLSR